MRQHRTNNSVPRSLRCVVVGDGAVGKTSMIVSYATDKFPVSYLPTVFDNYDLMLSINRHPYSLQLVDTAGQEDFDCLRPVCYSDVDVILVCFSVTDPFSFKNVSTKWIPEVTKYCPGVPYLIVGTMSDTRSNSVILTEMERYYQHAISTESGKDIAQQLNAVKYLECSALTQSGLKNVFDQAIIAAWEHKYQTVDCTSNKYIYIKKPKSRCEIL